LKQNNHGSKTDRGDVAPRAGAWIETNFRKHNHDLKQSRPPRGGVD